MSTLKEIKSMTTIEMVTEYNKLTGKSIKKFAKRADGERLLTAARKAAVLVHNMLGRTNEVKHLMTKKELTEAKETDKKLRVIKAAKEAEEAKAKAAEAKIKKTKALERKVAKRSAIKMTVLGSPFKRSIVGHTVRSMIVELVMAGQTNDEILKAVRKEFGKDKVPTSYPGWYRAQLRRNGSISY